MKSITLLFLTVFTVQGLFSQAMNVYPGSDEPIATVLGKPIAKKDAKQLVGLVFRPLLDKFGEGNKLEPTQKELDTFIVRMNVKQRENLVEMEQQKKQLQEELKSTTLTKEERTQRESSLQMLESLKANFLEMEKKQKEGAPEYRAEELESARRIVKSWKIYNALYKKYGGRVVFQQMGPEPLDAFRDFLKEQEKKGAFKILDTTYADAFWKYFTNDKMHSFYPQEEGEKLMNTPWWMMETPVDGK